MTEASVVPISEVQPDLSKFGEYLYKLMLSKGVRSFNALASAMNSSEFRIARQTVVKIAKGERMVRPNFARRLAEVLELDQKEKNQLAWMLYRWG